MTRAERIEAAARAMLESAETTGGTVRTVHRLDVSNLREALALPPDPPPDGTRETECIRALLGRLEREGIENDAVREARAILGITA